MDGDLTVEDTPDGGTTTVFSVPLFRAGTALRRRGHAEPWQSDSGTRGGTTGSGRLN
jgi:hypothetical protein